MEQQLRVGDWRVDPETNQLSRGDESVRVEPKAMDVLMLLATHVGRVVMREQIFAAVWPGVVVGDEALTQSIIKLRRALGDDSRAPAYIETIAKRGYRLIAPVVRDDTVSAVRPWFRPTPQQWRTVIALTGVILMIVGILGAYVLPWMPDTDAVSDASASRAETSATIAIGIAPFEALAGGDDAYLARGIADDLATDLSRVAGLRLIRAPAASPASARYRLSGTVHRDAGTLRINVFLADAATGEQVWAGRFERPYGDLFAVQDEITRQVLDVLPAKVSQAERQRAAQRYTRNLAAYDAFQHGQALFLIRSSDANEDARALYRKAIELDPKFARAYASLAMTYAMDYRLGSDAATLDRAFELAETARLIDPDIPQVYWALAFVHAQCRRHEQAIAALQRAIALDASFADAYALLGGIRTYIGQPGESIPLLRTAMRLNPDAGYLYYLLLGRAYLFQGDLDQALINLRHAALRNPADIETHVFLAAALAASGDAGSAQWEADEVRALQPAFSARDWLDTYPMTAPAQRERLQALLASVPL